MSGGFFMVVALKVVANLVAKVVAGKIVAFKVFSNVAAQEPSWRP